MIYLLQSIDHLFVVDLFVLSNCEMTKINTKNNHGMTKPEKKREGVLLKSFWDANGKPKYGTQGEFCDKIGLNQGQLQQMFSGSCPISIDTLLDLSIVLNFDPREIRPSLGNLYKKITYCFDRELIDSLRELTPSDAARIQELIKLEAGNS